MFLFWTFVFLAAVVLGLTYRSSQELKMVAAGWERAKAYFIAWSGLQTVIDILNKEDSTTDSYLDDWHKNWTDGKIKGTLKEGKWKLEYIYDTERYVDINKSGEDVLGRIYGQMPEFFDSLRDWLDKDSKPRPLGAEDDYYRAKGFNYECRDGAIRNLFEFGMIRGGDEIVQTPTDKNLGFPIPYSEPYEYSYASLNEENNILFWLLNFFLNECMAFAHSGGKFIPGPFPWPIGPIMPGPGGPWPFPISPGPPEEPPQGPPFEPPQPDPKGEGVTVYSDDGRVNINTALPQVLSALGFQRDTVLRIMWYRMSGNVFPDGETNTVITELIKTGWLKPRESLFQTIAQNIADVAGKARLKAKSSHFFVIITSETSKGAQYKVIAIIKRSRDVSANKTYCSVVAWWEWII
jgi:hypothetical protein